LVLRRFNKDVCYAVGNTSIRHGPGPELERPLFGPRRKLLASNIRVGLRVGRGVDIKGRQLHVESHMWAFFDPRYVSVCVHTYSCTSRWCSLF
jgi:hypothetical protein